MMLPLMYIMLILNDNSTIHLLLLIMSYGDLDYKSHLLVDLAMEEVSLAPILILVWWLLSLKMMLWRLLFMMFLSNGFSFVLKIMTLLFWIELLCKILESLMSRWSPKPYYFLFAHNSSRSTQWRCWYKSCCFPC